MNDSDDQRRPPPIGEPTIERGLVLRFCVGPSCGRHAAQLVAAARRAIAAAQLEHVVTLAEQCCFGRCFAGPNLLVERWRDGRPNEKAMLALMVNAPHPDMVFEHGVKKEQLPELIARHVASWREEER